MTAFSQTKKDSVTKKFVSAKPRIDSVDHYVVDLSINDLVALQNFVMQGDLYSDKGKQQFLESFFKRFKNIRIPADSVLIKK